MTQGDYAAMLRARGVGTDRRRAARLAAEALATADGLGMAGLVERVRPLAVEVVPD